MQKIIFTQDEINICKEFSEKVNTSFYANRNQFDNVKRMADANIGKLAEFAVYNSLIEKYPTLTLPDCNIYKPREKSWDYDLKSNEWNAHIKSQEVLQGSKYGISWIFENTDKHVFINYKPNDYVVFVSVNFMQKTAEIKSIVKVSTLHELQLFKKPVLAKLITKSAVYYDDLKDFEFEL